MYERGVKATTVDDILAASGTGKSQFYHYFSGKNALIIEVLSHQLDGILEQQGRYALDSWDGIVDWFSQLIEMHESRWGLGGCPLGSIAGEVIEQGEPMRLSAADAFNRWESAWAAALAAMRGRGELEQTADPAALAEAVVAIIQGGYLVSSIKRDIRPMGAAVKAASVYLRSHSPSRREGSAPH